MSAPLVEQLLARLYTDADFRGRFLEAPLEVARQAGLDAGEAQALARIDRDGLKLAAQSYAHKRAGRGGKGKTGVLAAAMRLLPVRRGRAG